MKNGRLYWSMLLLIVIFLTVAGAITYSNIKYAQEGTVQVVTRWVRLHLRLRP